MRKGMLALCLCSMLIVMAIPAFAVMGSYVLQAEDALTSGWKNVTPATSPCTISAMSDLDAVGGSALHIQDPGSTGGDHWTVVHHTALDDLTSTGTAVVRIKTTDAVPFSTDRWSRNFMFYFKKKGTAARRGIGLAIRPDSACVTDVGGKTLYPNVIYGDNTEYVTWTIVARSNGSLFDLYRNGVKVSNNISDALTGEASVMIGDGIDGIGLGSSNTVYLPNNVPPVLNPTGSWAVDGVAYRPGEHPYWNPFIPGGIQGIVKDAVTGQPVEGAKVSIGDCSITTDASGAYSFDEVNGGVHTVTVTRENGYYSRTLSIQVNEGGVTTRDIELVAYPAFKNIVYDTFSRADSTAMGTTEDPSLTPWVGDGTGCSIVNGKFVKGPSVPGNGIAVNGWGDGDFEATWKTYKNESSNDEPWRGDPMQWSGFHYGGWYADSFGNSMLFHWRANGQIVLFDAYGAGTIWQATPFPGIDWNQEHSWRVRVVGYRHQAWLDGNMIYDIQYGRGGGGWKGWHTAGVNAIFDDIWMGGIPAAPTGTINGKVYDINNPAVGLANAKVRVSDGQVVTTDTQGRYTVTCSTQNTVSLTAAYSDYYTNTISDVQALPGHPAVADIPLTHLPPAGETEMVTDHFERADGTDLGDTEAPNSFPWVRGSGESNASLGSGRFYLAPNVTCSGVSVSGYLPADIDMTVDLQVTPNIGVWGGIAYRQGQPGTFDSQNGQPADQAGYLVWCQSNGQAIHLWRNADIATKTFDTPIDWSISHKLRVRAIGPYHQVWWDDTQIIDAVDVQKLSGGYATLIRDNSEAWFDNLTIMRYTSDTGQISGTVLDAMNPSITVAGAKVMLNNGQLTRSDANGHYEFKRLANGTYTITAGSDDYRAQIYSNITIDDNLKTVIKDLKLLPIPATPSVTVYDDFERIDSENLGSTSVGNIPWNKAGETSTAKLTGGALYLSSLFAHGVSLNNSFQPADIDMSVYMSVLNGQWGGVTYRQNIPGTYDQYNGQAEANSGYLVWSPPDGSAVYLWRNRTLAVARLDTNPIMWFAPNKLRVRAIGGHHQVFIDRGYGEEKIIDHYDFGKLTGGFVGCFRESGDSIFYDFTVSAYNGYPCTVSGTVSDAADSTKKIAGAKIRFADGKIATTDANGFYTAEVMSWGTTSLQAIADTYRYTAINNINMVLNGTITQNITLNALTATTPAVDTFTRANSIDLGKTEDSIHRLWGKSDINPHNLYKDYVVIDNNQLALLELPTPVGSGVGVNQMTPIDLDLTADVISPTLTGISWSGIHYRCAQVGNLWSGYFMHWRGNGNVALFYGPGPEILTEITPDIAIDWTKTHKVRVKVIGPRHQLWVDDRLVLDYEDWHKLDGGYAGFSRDVSEFRADNLTLCFNGTLEMPQGKEIKSAVDAKKEAVGTAVSLTGPVVTAQFNGFFYVEDIDRTAGIKVVSTTTVQPGDMVTVNGTVQSADGEKYINATSVKVNSQTSQIKPLGMVNKSNAASVGVSNIGLLTTVWGKVTSLADDGTYCIVDDGSGASVKVLIAGTNKPAVDNYVSCIGIARMDTGGVAVLQMRSDADLAIQKQ